MGAADDDPSGIATYSQAGAQFGYGLLWTVFLTTPFMIAIQLVSAHIGRVTGKGIAANEPMTMRDRYAKNFAEALDFTERREAIDLPHYDPPPERACAAGGGWLELQVSREGRVKVICDGPTNADCSAKLMALEGELQLAHVPVTRIGQGSKVVLEMKLTEEGRTLLASASNRLPAVLETTVTDANGPVCRNVFSSILTSQGSR